MKGPKEELDKIEQALFAAHRRQAEVEFPADWRQQVMREVRAQARPAPALRMFRRSLSYAVVVLAAVFVYLVAANLDWHDPWINLRPVVVLVESRAQVSLEAGDLDSGLRHIKIKVIQPGKEVEVFSHEIQHPEKLWGVIGSTTKKLRITTVLDFKALDLQRGPAKLVVEVRDLSWRDNFQGRRATLEKEVVIDHLSLS